MCQQHFRDDIIFVTVVAARPRVSHTVSLTVPWPLQVHSIPAIKNPGPNSPVTFPIPLLFVTAAVASSGHVHSFLAQLIFVEELPPGCIQLLASKDRDRKRKQDLCVVLICSSCTTSALVLQLLVVFFHHSSYTRCNQPLHIRPPPGLDIGYWTNLSTVTPLRTTRSRRARTVNFSSWNHSLRASALSAVQPLNCTRPSHCA